jgi:hypothetical protein
LVNPKSRKKKAPERVLALPDLEYAKMPVLNSLTSASGQRTYDHAIREFVTWYCSEPRLASRGRLFVTNSTLRLFKRRDRVDDELRLVFLDVMAALLRDDVLCARRPCRKLVLQFRPDFVAREGDGVRRSRRISLSGIAARQHQQPCSRSPRPRFQGLAHRNEVDYFGHVHDDRR